MNIICLSLYYQYILDRFHFLKSPKTFRVIITIILSCPCYMPKCIPRLEGIMYFPSGRALCLLTLGHISAYNMDITILLYKYLRPFVQLTRTYVVGFNIKDVTEFFHCQTFSGTLSYLFVKYIYEIMTNH